MTVRIALFANKDSRQITEIAEAVTARGGRPVVLDLRIGGTPADSDQPTLLSGGAPDRCRWGEVDFSVIRAVHIRCTTPRSLPTMPAVSNPERYTRFRADFLREQAFQAATHAFFERLARTGTLVVNRLTIGYPDHDTKSQLYEKLRAAGFLVPRSLTTTDPDRARRFLAEVGEAVMKPMIGIGSTRLVRTEDMARFDDALPRCPVLFQERIVGPTMRVHVVADSMVGALEVIGDDIDSRTHPTSFTRARLPADEAAAIVRATRSLGLHYAAWDALKRADGRLVYVDCNPGPYLGWLPPDDRRIVFDRLALYLVTFAETGSEAQATAAVRAAG